MLLCREIMMSYTKGSSKNTKDKERLCRCLVFYIIGNRVGQKKSGLEINLRQNKSKKNSSIRRLTDGVEVGGNTKLSQGNRTSTNVFGTINTKSDGERVETKCSITFDRLEIIHNGNTKTGNRVKDGQDPVDWLVQSTKYSLTTPPGQRDVTGTESKVTGPTILLQLERRGRVNVGDKTTEDGKSEDRREFMSSPHIKTIGDAKTTKEEEPDLKDDLALTNLTARDGTVGLINGINLTIIPVVNGLRVPSKERSSQNHGNETLGGILKAKHNITIVGVERVPHPVVVATCRGAAHYAPDKGNPGNGFGQLKANLPNVGGFTGTLDAEELTNIGRTIGCLLVGSLGNDFSIRRIIG
mmetsp:Transcript_29727/g.65886  ORF Transcript_29727/g.65886 Transcript_29727/m.65886 type:complete len:355 (+) Transcript_29727:45-1109(+)